MKLLATVILASVCLVVEGDKNKVLSKGELRLFESLLRGSDLILDDAKPDEEFELHDDDLKRSFDPFKATSNVLKKACECNGSQCECCFTVPYLNYRGCLSGNAAEDGLSVRLNLDDAPIVAKTFPLSGRKEYCGALPKRLMDLNFCFTTLANPIQDGVSVCSSIDFRVRGQTGAVMNFQCIEIHGSTATLGGYQKAAASSYANFNVKAPFRAMVNLWQKRKALAGFR